MTIYNEDNIVITGAWHWTHLCFILWSGDNIFSSYKPSKINYLLSFIINIFYFYLVMLFYYLSFNIKNNNLSINPLYFYVNFLIILKHKTYFMK